MPELTLKGGIGFTEKIFITKAPTTQFGAPKSWPKLHNSKASRHTKPSRVHNTPKRLVVAAALREERWRRLWR